jgi:hypothetical protein
MYVFMICDWYLLVVEKVQVRLLSERLRGNKFCVKQCQFDLFPPFSQALLLEGGGEISIGRLSGDILRPNHPAALTNQNWFGESDAHKPAPVACPFWTPLWGAVRSAFLFQLSIPCLALPASDTRYSWPRKIVTKS